MFDRARVRDRKQLRVASLLAAVAGYIDAYSLIWLGLYVSFMSGNTTSLGMNAGKAHFSAVIAPTVAVPSFVLGSFAGHFALETHAFDIRRAIIALISACLFAAMAIGLASGPKLLEIAILCFGMGLVNPVHARVGTGTAGVTFVTGTLNRLGKDVALAVRGQAIANPEGPGDNYWRRARIDLLFWSSFVGGAVLSGLVSLYFDEMALLPAAAVMLALAVVPSLLADAVPPETLRGHGGTRPLGVKEP